MLVGINNASLGIEAEVIEPNVNREASSYLIDHYEELIAFIRKADIKDEKAHDLLHDVFISITEAEDDGNGFDMEFGSKVNEDGSIDVNLMCVEQFVRGRINMYAKNSKYRADIVEAGNSNVHETNIYYTSQIDKDGNEVLGKDGKVKGTKTVEHVKKAITVTSVAASFNEGGDVQENNDDFQKAFANASVADSTDDVAELLSLREQIDFCIDICELHGINIMNIFKNMDRLAAMLGDYPRKRKSAESVFGKLTELVNYHNEFAETLMDVMKFSIQHRDAFEAVIATY